MTIWRWSWSWWRLRWEVQSLIEDWTFREAGWLEGIEPWRPIE